MTATEEEYQIMKLKDALWQYLFGKLTFDQYCAIVNEIDREAALREGR